MKKYSRILGSILVIGMLAGAILPVFAQDTGHTEPVVAVQNVMWDPSTDLAGTQVDGAEAILTRMDHGISMSLTTSGLEPGNAYTIWWVIFNHPENCSDAVCGLDDAFLMDEDGQFILSDEGGRQPNLAGREMNQQTSIRATSTVAFEDGTAVFRAHLPIGDMTDFVLFGPGLLDPMEPEIHLIVRSHGPAQLETISDQLMTPWGGCPDPLNRAPCQDVQLAVFTAPSS